MTHAAIGHLMSDSGETPAGNRRRPLEVRVHHEPCRIGEDVMAGAYKRIVAVVACPLAASSKTSSRSTEVRRIGHEGAA